MGRAGRAGRRSAPSRAAGAILVEIIVVIGLKAGGRLSTTRSCRTRFGSPAQIGRLFLTDHLLAFEITSIVLLVAAVGGVDPRRHARAGGDGIETDAEEAG